ncbi:heterokaryon incompatibility protein-domain-containing protein [Rhexocercosporidium sp. MPI-PUGE-AT-0058]|nr:heterokaryon incompatibility protein-domain-containing protein [Rhexocercosporidium sp. MPI-PUGE-AT-0058]
MNLDWQRTSRFLGRQLIPSGLVLRTKKGPDKRIDKLCSICSKHDFRKLFSLAPDPLPQKEWETLYTIAHIQAHEATCSFCRLLCPLSSALKPHDGVSAVRTTVRVGRVYSHSFSIVKKSKSKRWHVPCLYVDGLERIQLIHQPGDTSRKLLQERLFRARPLKPFVDVDLLGEWLELCKENHAECWKTGETPRKEEWMEHDIKLIDLENDCVVNVTGICEYVALSYVWGGSDVPQLKLVKSTTQRLFTKGGLSSSHGDVPSTISDAMEVTRRFGKKYLWVDAVCIEQDNRDDQRQQIGQMHKIYINALLTIVAGYGLTDGVGIKDSLVGDSWVGLPGVKLPRDGQNIESVQGLQLANIGWLFTNEMNASSWNHRAWTFQELQFSKRLVFFTQHQIFYRCGEALWREDQYFEADTTISLNTLDMLDSQVADPEGLTSKQKFTGTEVDLFAQYKRLAGGISSRSLTNPNDILASFAGISNAMKETMHCEFIWGLPSTWFDEALLFESAARIPTSRRKGFPSWSWTGWIVSETVTSGRYSGSQMKYGINEADDQLYAEIEWYTVQERKCTKIARTAVLDARKFRELDVIRSSWRPPQLMPLPETIPPLPLHELEQLMVFQTSSAFVKVEANILRAGVYDTLFSADKELRTINLRKNAPALIYRMMPPDTNTETVEFIVIGTVAPRPDILTRGGMERNGETQAYLSLMAIETSENGVSERIGLVDGKVDVQEWLKYKPEWRTVLLL